jgi:hypothetical protein
MILHNRSIRAYCNSCGKSSIFDKYGVFKYNFSMLLAGNISKMSMTARKCQRCGVVHTH